MHSEWRLYLASTHVLSKRKFKLQAIEGTLSNLFTLLFISHFGTNLQTDCDNDNKIGGINKMSHIFIFCITLYSYHHILYS